MGPAVNEPLPLWADSPASPVPPPSWGEDLFGDATWSFDTAVVQPGREEASSHGATSYSRRSHTRALAENRLRVVPRKTDLPTLGAALRSEEKPALADLSVITLHVAKSLPISATLAGTAVQAALNRIQQKELHKELTEGASLQRTSRS